MVYIHIHRRLVSHKKQTNVWRIWNDRWKIKIDKILKSFMPCDDRSKYSKQLKEYLRPPTPLFKCTQTTRRQEKLNILEAHTHLLANNHMIIGSFEIDVCVIELAIGERKSTEGNQEISFLKLIASLTLIAEATLQEKKNGNGINGTTRCQMC